MFSKILIANRGEIAVRVIRACQEMGIRTVAVYSEIDRNAMHVQLAEEAWLIGPPAASESYLRGDKILEVAKQSGAEAIHPGYGFLSENAEFATAVEDAGLVWIGPPASAIRSMGSKTEARSIMMGSGVPVVPGTEGSIESVQEAVDFANRVGYPVLIKAAMGGGGKGMRVVRSEAELPSAIEAAKRESLHAFSSDIIFLEKYLERPRHIEIQVFADNYGNTIHLGERECSIQRRHQKVVEESPSTVVTPELRAQMGQSAVEAAKAVGYRGAGTIEFLVDTDLSYYFLEMNTRLQVEHPVTEMVTGIDLAQLQIRVAVGEKLPYVQEDIVMRGHAIEVRICTEDCLNGFVPDTGKIRYLRAPDGFGVREDSGIREGDIVSIHYDPMISKLITWGPDRPTAIKRMYRALREYRITGVHTTIQFGRLVMKNTAFQRGDYDTSFVESEFDVNILRDREAVMERIAALGSAWRHHNERNSNKQVGEQRAVTTETVSSSWKANGRRRALR